MTRAFSSPPNTIFPRTSDFFGHTGHTFPSIDPRHGAAMARACVRWFFRPLITRAYRVKDNSAHTSKLSSMNFAQHPSGQ
jgi:hypothetical protein